MGLKSASTVVSALSARSAVGLESASTVVTANTARSAVVHQSASTVVYALAGVRRVSNLRARSSALWQGVRPAPRAQVVNSCIDMYPEYQYSFARRSHRGRLFSPPPSAPSSPSSRSKAASVQRRRRVQVVQERVHLSAHASSSTRCNPDRTHRLGAPPPAPGTPTARRCYALDDHPTPAHVLDVAVATVAHQPSRRPSKLKLESVNLQPDASKISSNADVATSLPASQNGMENAAKINPPPDASALAVQNATNEFQATANPAMYVAPGVGPRGHDTGAVWIGPCARRSRASPPVVGSVVSSEGGRGVDGASGGGLRRGRSPIDPGSATIGP